MTSRRLLHKPIEYFNFDEARYDYETRHFFLQNPSIEIASLLVSPNVDFSITPFAPMVFFFRDVSVFWCMGFSIFKEIFFLLFLVYFLMSIED